MCPQNRPQSCLWTSAAHGASSCCSPTPTWSRTGAPTTSGQEASDTRSATRGHCCHHLLQIATLCVCPHRQGLQHLMELVRHPIIFITLEGQSKRMSPEVKQQLSEHQHRLTVLTWKHNSVVGPAASTHDRSRANKVTLSHTLRVPLCLEVLLWDLQRLLRAAPQVILPIRKYMMANFCSFTSFLNSYCKKKEKENRKKMCVSDQIWLQLD